MQLNGQKERMYSHECFHNISGFVLPSNWMSHSKTMNNRIDKIHQKTSRLVYIDETIVSFDNLQEKDKSVSIHQRNLQMLATESFKLRNDLRHAIMKYIFHFVKKPNNLRNDSTLHRQRNHTVCFGTESLSSLAPKIWRIVPCEIKNTKSLLKKE